LLGKNKQKINQSANILLFLSNIFPYFALEFEKILVRGEIPSPPRDIGKGSRVSNSPSG
jgi:hypothetical protein